jgi:hypothetical protein
MKAMRIALSLAAVLVAGGCKKDAGPFLNPTVPLAYVRYIAAVPDTFGMDWRPIDAVENSPPAVGLQFRSTTPYQAMAPGARRLRIFPAPVGDVRDPSVVSQIVIDETINFTANTYYTVIHLGFSRTGQTPEDRLVVLEDAVPASIPDGQFALRVVHVGTGLNPVDAYVTATSSAAIAGSPAFSNVAYGDDSPYVLMPTGTVWLRVTDAGSTTELVSNNSRQAPPGAAGDPVALLTPIGGASMAKSALTAFVFPRTVAGSTAPQATNPGALPPLPAGISFQAPSVVYLVDKHPPQ